MPVLEKRRVVRHPVIQIEPAEPAVGPIQMGLFAPSLLAVRVAIRPVWPIITGCAGGITGAPPMALLYQHEEARRSAAMQNAFYAFGMIVSVPVLSVAGLIGWRHLVLAVSLAPVAVAATILIARQLFAA